MWLWPNTSTSAPANRGSAPARASRPRASPVSCTTATRTPSSSARATSGRRARSPGPSLLPNTPTSRPGGPGRSERRRSSRSSRSGSVQSPAGTTTSARSASAQTTAGRSRARRGTWVSARTRSRSTGATLSRPGRRARRPSVRGGGGAAARGPRCHGRGAARADRRYGADVTEGTNAASPPVEGSEDSVLTVLVAGLANLLIAAAKFVGATISGSSSMLSESAHSLADTVTEVLLFVAIRRGSKPADELHPLGYGREAYLWSLLAAFATFLAGAVVSVVDGVERILHGGDTGDPRVAFVVLAVAFVLEGTSLLRALRQVRGNARRYRVRIRTFLEETTDTAVKAVTFEDSAALVGLVLAALGLGLTHLTGQSFWDGASSVLIGVLLFVVA